MTHLSIDIETYSELSLPDVGLYRYAADPSFRVLLVAFAVDDSPVEVIDMERRNDTRADAHAWNLLLDYLHDDTVILHAYNAVFEWYCLAQIKLRTSISRWRCTMVHGLYLGYSGSLGDMGAAVGIPEDKQKLKIGRALIRRFSIPDSKGRRVLPEQEPEKWELYKQYNRNDVEAERALEQRFSPWPLPEREQVLWEQDILMNAAGIRVDTRLVLSASEAWADEQEELLAESKAITGLDNPQSVAQLKGWVTERLQMDAPVSICKADVQDMLQDRTIPHGVRRALENRQQLGKTSVSKYDALTKLTSPKDERVRGLTQFYGAHTGRWSGRGIQVHNLPRQSLSQPLMDIGRGLLREGYGKPSYTREAIGLIYNNLPDTLSQLIRTMLIPAKGNRFIIADYSAIEARVVAWLAGETWVNEVFATHGKIYEAAAAQMFGVPIDSIRKGKANYGLRAKGKVATLALGYGGGAQALVAMGALRMGLTEEELPDIVSRWRESNRQIKALWYALQNATVNAVKTGNRIDVRGLGVQMESYQQDRYLTIALPAGRKLFYPSPQIDINKYGKEELSYQTKLKSGFVYTRIWGGTLTENVVQAIARDCLADLLLRIPQVFLFDDTQGIRFHVHDEVIVEVGQAQADIKLKQLLQLMADPIPWAPGLLLKGDGFVGDYYRKD